MAPQDIGGAKIQGYVPGGDQQAQEKIEGQYGRYKNRLRREIGAIASTAGTRAPLVLSRTEQNAAEDHFFEKPGAKSGETLALAHKLEQSTQNEIDRLALTHEEVSHLHRSMSSVPREDVTPAQKTLHERLGRYIGGHISGDEEMQKSLFPSSETAVHKIMRVPDGIARGIFHAEEREHKYQLSGFDKSTLSTRHTKSSGSPVDYAQKVAKSKFRRGAHG
jgi:hypothetical protein